MWFKVLILFNLALVLISLFGGAYFLTLSKDLERRQKRLVQLLTIRVSLSICLILLLVVGYYFGLIKPHGL